MLAVSDVYAEEAYFASTKLILPMLKFQLRFEYILLHFVFIKGLFFFIYPGYCSVHTSDPRHRQGRRWCGHDATWHSCGSGFWTSRKPSYGLRGSLAEDGGGLVRRPPRWSSPPAAQLEASGRRPPSRSPNRSGCSFFLKRKPSRLPRLYSCILINSEELEKAKVKKKTKAVQLIYVRKKKGL